MQLPLHFCFVELVDASSGKEGTAATETVQTPGDQHQARGVSIKPMHQMVISRQPLQPRDQGILQVIAAAGLRQQSRRFQHHQQPGVPIKNRRILRARAAPHNAV